MESSTAEISLKVRLVVTSSTVAPVEILNFLGVQPTKIWFRGEPVHPKATDVHKENGWVLSLESGPGSGLVVCKLIDRLISMVPNGKLPDMCKHYQGSLDVEISVIAYLGTNTIPYISLTPPQVAFLAQCNGSFDVDLYLDVPDTSD